jgi:hypothetical protein
VYTETLFWILTLLPIATPPATKTFWPRTQPLPSFASAEMWQKCQIFEPSPISHGWST